MLPTLEDVEMKNRMFVALLLAGVLALPALARQAAPNHARSTRCGCFRRRRRKPALQPDTHGRVSGAKDQSLCPQEICAAPD